MKSTWVTCYRPDRGKPLLVKPRLEPDFLSLHRAQPSTKFVLQVRLCMIVKKLNVLQYVNMFCCILISRVYSKSGKRVSKLPIILF